MAEGAAKAARIAQARRDQPKTGRKAKEPEATPREPLIKLDLDLLSSGGVTFSRARDLWSSDAVDLTSASVNTVAMNRRKYPRVTGELAAAHGRMLMSSGGRAPCLPIKQATPRALDSAAPAGYDSLFDAVGPGCSLPGTRAHTHCFAPRASPHEATPRMLHSRTGLTPRPEGSHVTTLPWSGCSLGARLRYARTTAVRGNAGETGRPNGGTVSMRSQPQCYAVGPAEALRDCSVEGRYFEVRVELCPRDVTHFANDGHSGGRGVQEDVGVGQRPLLLLGVSHVPPPEQGLGCAPEIPYDHGDLCYSISTTGHVRADGQLVETVPVKWPDAPQRSRAAGLCPGLQVGLLISEHGALRLFVNGDEVATSSAGVVPRPRARGAEPLFPVVGLGPNVDRVTLKPSGPSGGFPEHRPTLI